MAVHEGRLELDDDGLVVGGGTPVLLGEAPSLGPLDGSSTARNRSRRRRRTGGAALAAGALAAVLLASGSLVGGPGPDVEVRAEPAGVERAAYPRAPLVVDYRITSTTPLRGGGLIGPGVLSSTAAVGADGSLRVSAVADCTDADMLDEPSTASYAVRLESGSGPVVVPAPDGSVGWADALRRACWLQRSAEGLRVADVAIRTDDADRWLGLDLLLTSTTGRDLRASSVEFVDRTRAGADSAVVPDGGAARLLVRMPLAGCGSGTAGARTTVPWRVSLAVGPVGVPPLTEVAVDLSRQQRAVVAAAVAERCSAPAATG